MSADIKFWFSAEELSLLAKAGLAEGIARSARRSGETARKLGWLNRKVLGKGGRGGMRTEFNPPHDVLSIIQAFLKKNPDFFTKAKGHIKNKPSSKLYPVSKATALPLKSPEPEHAYAVIDSEIMIFVMTSVDSLMEKQGLNISHAKKYELIMLIYDYCMSTGRCDEGIVAKFLKLAG